MASFFHRRKRKKDGKRTSLLPKRSKAKPGKKRTGSSAAMEEGKGEEKEECELSIYFREKKKAKIGEGKGKRVFEKEKKKRGLPRLSRKRVHQNEEKKKKTAALRNSYSWMEEEKKRERYFPTSLLSRKSEIRSEKRAGEKKKTATSLQSFHRGKGGGRKEEKKDGGKKGIGTPPLDSAERKGKRVFISNEKKRKKKERGGEKRTP